MDRPTRRCDRAAGRPALLGSRSRHRGTLISQVRSGRSYDRYRRNVGKTDRREDKHRSDDQRGDDRKGLGHLVSPCCDAEQLGCRGECPASHWSICRERRTVSRTARRRRSNVRHSDKDGWQFGKPTRNGQARFSLPDPAAEPSTIAASATSSVTFPTVRKMSGTISTATSSASGAMGTPSARAIGAIELM